MLNDHINSDILAKYDRVLFPYINHNISELMILKDNIPDNQLKKIRIILNKTEIAQPAILLHSILCFNKLTEKPKYLLGPSLGEIISLVAAGSINIYDAGVLLFHRGLFMQNSCPEGKGSMISIIGDINITLPIFNEFKSNKINISSMQRRMIVVSGEIEEINSCATYMKSKGIAYKKLIVSAAFHSHLMEGGKKYFKEYLNESGIVFNKPIFPILSTVKNVTLNSDIEDFDNYVKDLLIEQFTETVDIITPLKKCYNEGLDVYEVIKKKEIDFNDYI